MPDEIQVDEQFVRDGAHVGINVVALITSRFVALVLTLAQTGVIFRELDHDVAGQFVFALGYTSLFSVFATLGIQRLLVRDIARDPNRGWACVWAAEFLVAGLSTLVILAIAGSAAAIVEGPDKRTAIIFASFSVVGLWALQRPFEAMLIARERMGMLAIVNIVAAVLKLLSVILVLRTTQTSAAAHAAIAAANAVAFLVCIGVTIGVAGWEWPRFRVSLLVDQVRESFPFAVAMIFSLIYFKADITLLDQMRGDEATAVYAPTQRLMEPLLMLAGLWGTALFPALCRLSLVASENYAKLKHTAIRLALLLAFPMACGIASLSEPIILLLTGDTSTFHDSIFVLRLYAAVIPFFYFNGITQEFFYSAHRNWYVVWAYAFAAVISVLGNLVAIPILGVPGLALVAVVANASVTLIFSFGMRTVLTEIGFAHLLSRTLFACTLMSVTVYAVGQYALVFGVLIGVVVYAGLVWRLTVLNDLERQVMRQAVLNIVSGVWRRE